ncbi:MAG: multiheme c-type cytochrome [Polyangiaceae bacterium]
MGAAPARGRAGTRAWIPRSVGVVAGGVLLVLGAASQRSSHAASERLSELPPVAQNARCEECHADVAREWRGSGHQLAFTRPEFQRALVREPKHAQGFCSDCHAPESVTERKLAGATDDGVSAEAGALGVACTSCHAEQSPSAQATRVGNGLGRTAPHGFMGTAGDAACGACHDFSFQGKASSFAMQRTLAEHRAASSEATCVSCHMARSATGPAGANATHWSHSFPGGRDAKFVASALSVTASRLEPGSVRITLTPRDVTHAVPTGDLFRRLAVSVELPDGSKLERYLARHFADSPRGRREVSDDRVHLTPRQVDFVLPRGMAGAKVRWQVSYQRVAHVDPDREGEATLDGWSLVGGGEL